MEKSISKHTLQRLPAYLRYLHLLPEEIQHISATALAAALDMGEVQVRKDLASVSTSGKPKIGYAVTDLIEELELFLGYKDVNNAVIVGAGKLGMALLDYAGFQNYGLNIVAAFDCDSSVVGQTPGGKNVFSMDRMDDLCARMRVRIGIITVPAAHAQNVCDRLVADGILAIWNFAPAHLSVPPGIIIQNEDMAASLALLSSHLSDNMRKGGQKSG